MKKPKLTFNAVRKRFKRRIIKRYYGSQAGKKRVDQALVHMENHLNSNAMDLVTNFYRYCSCYEIPRNYAVFSALGLIGATLNRKCFIRQGDIVHSCSLYICLVGVQGSKKSTAMWWAWDLFKTTFPHIPLGSSVQSREAIIKNMAGPEGTLYYKDHEDTTIEYHPYMLFVNEFENFLSFNIPGMVSFLVDIFDRNFFDSSTIVRGLESFPNPAVNLLACCTPRWLINKLKGDIITGGICRRIIFVYESDAKADDGNLISIPRPTITKDAFHAKQAVKDHLPKIDKLRGEFQWQEEGKEYFDEWYHENKRTMPDDPVMQGYRRTKDIQLLKIAMCLAASEPEPRLLLTKDHLELGLAYLASVEHNMPKLSAAAGRNELSGPQQMLLEMLENGGGFLTEVELRRKMEKDLNHAELNSVLYHLRESDQIVVKRMKHKGIERMLIMTKQFYAKHEGKSEV
jgi:hypothetical protein